MTETTSRRGKVEGKAQPLPPWTSQAYIAIFEDGLDQLGVLADIEPDVTRTHAKPVCFILFIYYPSLEKKSLAF